MTSLSQADAEYTRKLKLKIKDTFVFFIKPFNVLSYFHKYDLGILTQCDTDNITAVTNTQGDSIGSARLLELLCVYPGWLDCLDKVLRDPMVKLNHVADKMLDHKRQLDQGIEEENNRKEEQVKRLQEEIRQKEARNAELEREKQALEREKQRVERKRDHLGQIVQRQEREKQEREKLDHITEKLRVEKTKLEQEKQKQDQIIKKQEKEKNELEGEKQRIEREKQERDEIIDKQKKELDQARVETLHLALSTSSESDGVILFNFFVKSRLHLDHPDMAKKYSISPRCDVPAALKHAAEMLLRLKRRFTNDTIDIMKQSDVGFMKKFVTGLLHAMHGFDNTLRDNVFDEDTRKIYLLHRIELLFYTSYIYFTTLETRGVKEMSEFLLECRDSIIKILDPLMDELGGWSNVVSDRTVQMFLKMSEADKQLLKRLIIQARNPLMHSGFTV